MASLSIAEGLVELIYKYVADAHKRVVDDVVVSVKPPEGCPVVDAAELSGEQRELVAALVRQDTSRTAFKRTYKEKMDSFKASAQELQQRVDVYMAEAGKQELVIGLKGQDQLQIKIKRRDQEPPVQAGAGGAGAGAGAGAAESLPPPPTQKELLCQAVEATLRTLRVDPKQPYDPISAVQLLAHPQTRPLINRAMHDKQQELAGSARTTSVSSRKGPPVSAVVRVKPT